MFVGYYPTRYMMLELDTPYPRLCTSKYDIIFVRSTEGKYLPGKSIRVETRLVPI